VFRLNFVWETYGNNFWAVMWIPVCPALYESLFFI